MEIIAASILLIGTVLMSFGVALMIARLSLIAVFHLWPGRSHLSGFSSAGQTPSRRMLRVIAGGRSASISTRVM